MDANKHETILKRKLEHLNKQLEIAKTESMAILVPGYRCDIEDEIDLVMYQLNRIKTLRKTTLKVVK